MKSNKRILSILLAVTMILTFMPAMAFAEVQTISGPLPSPDSNGVIDLGGNTYIITNDNKFVHSSGDVLIKNGRIETQTTDIITATGGTVTLGEDLTVYATKGAAIYANGGSVVINGAVVDGGDENANAFAENAGSITVKNGTLKSETMALSVNGTGTALIEGGTVTSDTGTAIRAGSREYNATNGTITITGGVVSSSSTQECTAWARNGGKIIFEGGTITGHSGLIATAKSSVEMRGGTINVTNGQYAFLAHEGNAIAELSGGTVTGAIGAGSSNPGDNNTLTITGGTVNGTVYQSKGTVSISGGVFKDDVSEFIAGSETEFPEKVAAKNAEGMYEVVPPENVTAFVAREEGANKYYMSLDKAVEELEDGDALAVIKAEEGTVINTDKKVQVDNCSGNTIKVNGQDVADNGSVKADEAAALSDTQKAANEELDKVDLSKYQEPELSAVKAAIADAKAAIAKAGTPEAVKAALDGAKASIAAQAVFDPSLPKVTAKKAGKAKKALTAKWKKLSKKNQKNVSGIEIQIARDKGFTQDVKNATAKKTKTSKKIKKLAKKKNYWVRARTYKNVNGVKYVGKWSKVKKVKTK